jgi:hypothetical protein
VAEPLRREGTIDVRPAELGDEAALPRMRHRVRLKRIGRAWLRLDAPPIGEEAGDSDEDAIAELMPAIGETANRIRVVTEEDGARVAVWIDRRDVWDSIVAPVKLDGGAGPIGVWLEPGAPVRVARVRARTVRIVELRDDAVEARGSVPPAFVGHVWIVPHDDRTPTDMARTCPSLHQPPPADPRRMVVAAGTEIRAAAAETAALLATVRGDADADAVVLRRGIGGADGEGWAELEVRRPYARVRGFAPESALEAPGELGSIGWSCSGHGFGMSHADRIDVPVGTCLFDGASGDVVGVATETQTRLGSLGGAGDPWSMVHVDTRWSVASLYVYDGAGEPGRRRLAPDELALESCTSARHRR